MPALEHVDPFDLPEWLGEGAVIWSCEESLGTGHLVRGRLSAAHGAATMACDLHAVDEAHPCPVASDAVRTRTHQAWCHGQVLVASEAGRTRLLVPGTGFDADRVLEVIGRLAKALGVPASSYAVLLHLG